MEEPRTFGTSVLDPGNFVVPAGRFKGMCMGDVPRSRDWFKRSAADRRVITAMALILMRPVFPDAILHSAFGGLARRAS